MTFSNNLFFSKILHKDILNLDDSVIGNLNDVLIDSSGIKPTLTAIEVKNGKRIFYINCESLEIYRKRNNQFTLKLNSQQITFASPPENAIFLAKDILDRQIIDINGRKVERVNDIRIGLINQNWAVIAADIGLRGLIRRLGMEYMGITVTNLLKREFHNKLVVWDDVQPLISNRDNLQLTQPFSKLTTMHAADIADIIEDLDRQAQIEVFKSLDNEQAADVLEEVDSDVQVSLLEQLPIEQAADVLEMMPQDEVADILEEFEDLTAEKLLIEMEEHISEEIRELMEYDDRTVGSLMMTDMMSFDKDENVKSVLKQLRREQPEEDITNFVYVTDNRKLVGVISLIDLIHAKSNRVLRSLMKTELVLLKDTDKIEFAMEQMQKYNLMILPVIDEHDELIGIVSLMDIVYEYIRLNKVDV
ncbi:MAG: MgtE integral membrane protein [Erysipelotrichaceae bacterium]|nr:MAG: MgtE integral membrane [Erysipelotrichaceae bacterium]TXT18312.1 MAG: MgtE integral membrane protein [Erysipelotrichaceae bacterium]